MYRQWSSSNAESRARLAARDADRHRAAGVVASPVRIQGRTIATSFWGKAWCDAMESYGDYASRLPRGRTYVRTGAVVDLRIEPGEIRARVSGSRMYTTTVTVADLPPAQWRAVVEAHAGQVSSLVDLLSGRLPDSLLRALANPRGGLFPHPTELQFDCSCPDWAVMCKHVAAVLYGVGSRLDHDPGLFFTLRGVDVHDLVSRGVALEFGAGAPDELAGADLGDLFGIDLVDPAAGTATGAGATATKPARTSGATTVAATTVAATKPAAKARGATATKPAAKTRGATAAKARATKTKPASGAQVRVQRSTLEALGLTEEVVEAWVRDGKLDVRPDGTCWTTPETTAAVAAWMRRR